MPRSVLAVRPPFGGMIDPVRSIGVGPNDAPTLSDVFTRWGEIRKRLGYRVFRTKGALNDPAYIIKHAVIAVGSTDTSYAYLWVLDGSSQTVHTFVSQNGATTTSLAAIGASLPHPGFMNAYGRVYLPQGDPAASMKVYYNGSALVQFRIGIVAPAVGNSQNTAAGGSLGTGTFDYRYTYYNALADVESGPSPVVSVTSVVDASGTETITVDMTGSADLQVGKLRLYRRQRDVDSTWFYVGQIDNYSTWTALTAYALSAKVLSSPPTSNKYFEATTAGTSGAAQPAWDTTVGNTTNDGTVVWTCRNMRYTDDGSVTVDKSFSTQMPLVTTVPPTSNCVCWHQRRAWWVDGVGGTKIRYSEVDRPELVSAFNSYQFGERDNDPIIAQFSLGGTLWVLKRRSVWCLVGDGPGSWSVRKVSDNAGCIGQHSVVIVGQDAYWAGENGAWKLRGGQLEFAGSTITKIWKDTIRSVAGSASALGVVGAYEPYGNSVLFIGSYTPATQMLYQIDAGRWSRWTIPMISCGNMPLAASADNSNTLLFGSSTNDIVRYGSKSTVTDDPGFSNPVEDDGSGSTVAWTWTTGKLDMGTRLRKTFYYATIRLDGNPAGNAVTVECSVDGGAFATVGTITVTSADARMRLGRRGEFIQLRFSGAHTTEVRVLGYDIDFQTAGRR